MLEGIREHGRGNTAEMDEAKQGIYARKGRVVERGKFGKMREARPGRCARQARADA
jgi:hypothetical protein